MIELDYFKIEKLSDGKHIAAGYRFMGETGWMTFSFTLKGEVPIKTADTKAAQILLEQAFAQSKTMPSDAYAHDDFIKPLVDPITDDDDDVL